MLEVSSGYLSVLVTVTLIWLLIDGGTFLVLLEWQGLIRHVLIATRRRIALIVVEHKVVLLLRD